MKRKKGLLLAVLMLILLVLPSCGKKGRPFVRQRQVFLEVKELKAEYESGTVFLSGKAMPVPGQSTPGAEIIGCRVYHSWYKLSEPPCEGCPIEFPGYKQIKKDVVEGENFSCHLGIEEKKGIHLFEVRLLGEKGAVGPPSNRVKMIIKD